MAAHATAVADWEEHKAQLAQSLETRAAALVVQENHLQEQVKLLQIGSAAQAVRISVVLVCF